MHALFSFVNQPLQSDKATLARSVIFLRLTILLFAGLIFASVHLFYQRFEHSLLTLGIFVAVATWSIFLLRQEKRLHSEAVIAREMLIDFGWVLVVVVLTGGSANPFIYYYLVLTAVCATTLRPRLAWTFCLAGIVIYSVLVVADTQAHLRHMPASYRLHLSGMWLNFVLSTLVTCFFVTRLTRLLRSQQEQFAAFRELNLKNEQLIGIGTVAASTVHSLATPITTLTVLAEEIVSSDGLSNDIHDDVNLMLEQIERCKHTMDELSSIAQGGSAKKIIKVAEFLLILEEHYSLNTPATLPRFMIGSAVQTRQIECNTLFQYALINLINNAMESGSGPPAVNLESQAHNLRIRIENTSALTQEEIIRRWGKPTRSEKPLGLGIGSLLANSTIEQQGGIVELETFVDSVEATNSRIFVTITMPFAQE